MLAGILFGDVRAHQAQRLQQAGAARVQSDRAQAQFGPRNDAGGDQEERRRGEVGRHRDVGGLQALPATQAREAGREFDVDTERFQHALGVVTGGMRLAHHGVAIGIQAGQQHGGLHLGAGDLKRVVDARQLRASVDAQRRQAALLGIDARTHRGQRPGDAAHGAPGQGFVADQHAVEPLRGQQAGQQAHAGAGITAVQRALRGPQAIDAHAVHDAARGRRCFDPHAEPREDRRGGARVLAFEEAVDRRGAIGQRSEHHRAMRHRLVAGDVQGAVQRLAGGGDPVLCHGKSLRVLRMEEIGGQSE